MSIQLGLVLWFFLFFSLNCTMIGVTVSMSHDKECYFRSRCHLICPNLRLYAIQFNSRSFHIYKKFPFETHVWRSSNTNWYININVMYKSKNRIFCILPHHHTLHSNQIDKFSKITEFGAFFKHPSINFLFIKRISKNIPYFRIHYFHLQWMACMAGQWCLRKTKIKLYIYQITSCNTYFFIKFFKRSMDEEEEGGNNGDFENRFVRFWMSRRRHRCRVAFVLFCHFVMHFIAFLDNFDGQCRFLVLFIVSVVLLLSCVYFISFYYC